MKDNEIKKALEVCAYLEACADCPFGDIEGVDKCMHSMMQNALDLINRQQAEIERLQKENEILSVNADNAFQEGLNESRELFKQEVEAQIKDEAIKKFAERFKNELTKIEEIYFEEEHENFISANKVIALLVNLVQETESENNETNI